MRRLDKRTRAGALPARNSRRNVSFEYPMISAAAASLTTRSSSTGGGCFTVATAAVVFPWPLLSALIFVSPSSPIRIVGEDRHAQERMAMTQAGKICGERQQLDIGRFRTCFEICETVLQYRSRSTSATPVAAS